MNRALAAILVLTIAACGRESVGQPAPAPAPTKAASAGFPKPDRPVATIVSPTWSSGPDRDAADESGQLIRAMGIRSGMAVADIGAGSGYHTLRLSPVVGPTGKVFAQDVTKRYLDELGAEVERRRLSNVTLVLGEPDDPKIPAGSVDAAILVHMYHEIENPYALLWNLAPSLKAGGKVGVIDLNRSTRDHGTPPDLLRCEFEAVGYRQLSYAALEGEIGYLAIFAPPTVEERPAPSAIRPCPAPARR